MNKLKTWCTIVIIFCIYVIWVCTLFGQTYSQPTNISITNDGMNPVNITDVSGNNALDVNVTSILTTSVRTSLATTITTSQIAVSNTATLIRAANTSRFSLGLRNHSTTTDFYLGTSAVTTLTGVLVRATDSIFLDRNTAAIYGITSSGTTTVGWIEE